MKKPNIETWQISHKYIFIYVSIFLPDIPVAKLSLDSAKGGQPPLTGDGGRTGGRAGGRDGGRAGATTAIRRGETLVMNCHVQANPGIYNVTWYHNVSTAEIFIYVFMFLAIF